MQPVLVENVLHTIFQHEFLLLDRDFFELFGLRKVWSSGEFVEAIVESVMLVGESVEFLVTL